MKEIQLAIQGGGAKVCCLLAAMEAVQSLQQKGVLKVTKIAGTSAGAIAGSLFAAGVSIEGFRKQLVAGLGERLVRMFEPPGRLKMARHLFSGSPFWDEEELKRELEGLFVETKARRVGDFASEYGIKVLIVSSNLADGRRVIASDDEFIVNALLNSAGIPFCFRGWKRPNPRIVDGGICNNFPWEELGQGSKADGEIVGISFKPRRPTDPTSLMAFSMGLLDSAIDNSMEQARLGRRDSIFSIDTLVGTFDFVAAMEFLKSPAYGALRKEAEDFFTQFVAKEKKKSIVVNWDEQNQTMMQKLGQIYKTQHQRNNLHYRHCSVEVVANSLLEGNEDPDIVTYSTTFCTLSEPIYCFRIAITQTTEGDTIDETKTSWEVFSDTGPVEVICLPMKDPGVSKERQLLLSFNPVLSQASPSPYTLRFQDLIPGALLELKTKGRDELSFQATRAADSVEQIDLVLYVPPAYSDLEFELQKPSDLGRRMNEKDLTNYKPPHPGLAKVGWTGRALDANKPFAVNLVPRGTKV